MNFKRTLISSSLVIAGMMSASLHAATLTTKQTKVLGAHNSTTSAVFSLGASFNDGANYLQDIPSGSAADLTIKITTDPNDVSTDGDLYVVVRVGSSFYSLTQSGPQAWNFDGATGTGLVPYSSKTLVSVESIKIADFEAAMGMSLDGKTAIIHAGYMSDVSNLNYSSGMGFRFAAAPSNATCPAGATMLDPVPGAAKVFCQIEGEYTSDLHLTSNFEYVIKGGVFIGGDNENSATITMDPGVKAYGASGNDFLVIRRGSSISVNGTAAKPVIMTSANDKLADSTTRGDWGGLIINGNAPINGCNEGTEVCEAEGEGSTGKYGGNNPADSSGNLNYLQVKYAGYEITPDNELNGIAFQGVGSGTLVDYVQVHNNKDDGVEFFGGTVNAKHLYLSGNSDDSVDWTKGWTGKLQHVVVFQTDAGDQGIEADSNSSNRDSSPRAKPVISNITLLGNTNTDYGMLLREGTGANISNAIVVGFGDECIDIDHTETFTNAGSSATDLSGELTITNSLVHCPEDGNFEVADADEPWSVADWYNNQAGNNAFDPGMTGFVNSAAVNALTPASQSDSWFDATDYIGAVKDSGSDWTSGWTYKD